MAEYKQINVAPQSEEDFEIIIETDDPVDDALEDNGSTTVVETPEPEEIIKQKDEEIQKTKKTQSRSEKRIKELLNDRNDLAAKLEAQEQKIRELEQGSSKANKDNKESLKGSLESQIATLNQQMVAAIESGDGTTTVQIQDKLMDAKMKLASVSYELANHKEPDPVKAEPAKKEVKPSEKAMAWVAEYPAFSTDPVFYAAAMAVNNLQISQGLDPEDDSFYEALNEKLSPRFPEIFGTTNKNSVESNTKENKSSEGTQNTKEKVEQTVSGASRTASTTANGKPQNSSKTKVSLSQEEINLAKRWGITPEKYAKRKLGLQDRQDDGYTPINV